MTNTSTIDSYIAWCEEPLRIDYEKEAELERQEDELLKQHGFISKNGSHRPRSCYTEKQLRDLARRHEQTNHNETLNLYTMAKVELSESQEYDIIKMIERAHLTKRELLAWTLHKQRETGAYIGDQLGVTASRVYQLIHEAQRKLERTLLINPYWGLHEVYWSEVLRIKIKRVEGFKK
jgi:DNA-directed RNA polymerase specialized sigma subunit